MPLVPNLREYPIPEDSGGGLWFPDEFEVSALC
jgi:hypothetical protein